MEIISKKAEDTEKLAKKIAQFLKPQDIILLDGDLGAGKTTFTKGLALGLGIKKNVKVQHLQSLENIMKVDYHCIIWMFIV